MARVEAMILAEAAKRQQIAGRRCVIDGELRR